MVQMGGGLRQLRVSRGTETGQRFWNDLFPAKKVIWHLGEFSNNYSAFNIRARYIPSSVSGTYHKFIEVVVPSFQMCMYDHSGKQYPFIPTVNTYPTDITIESYPYGSVTSGVKVTALDSSGEEMDSFTTGSCDFLRSIIRPTVLEINSTNGVSFYDAFPDFKILWEVVDDINDYDNV